MNKVYCLVWSPVLNAHVPVAETSRGRGKGSGRKLIAAALLLNAALALAEPTGGQISAGTGSIAQAGANTTITQNSQNLAINWQSFNIGTNEAVRFNQPNATAIALNRVLGQDPSQILGSLSANGQVFVLNPNGVLFGTGSQVNVGGLVASTLSLGDADFIAGKYSLSNGGTAGTVVNKGTLTAANRGYIALLAPEVRNEGVISATLGTALLAAGDKVTLNLNNGSLLSYSIDQGALKALTENKHLIQADGGQVFMSAKAANALTTAMVNNTGIIQARTVQNVAGVIMLMGDMQVGTVNVGGTLDASAPNGGNGGFIETSAATVKVADGTRVSTFAPVGNAGTWLIDPTDFTIGAGSGASTPSGIGADTLTTNLRNGNVIIVTSAQGSEAGDIFVNSAVSWSANKLTLSAHRNININANLNASGTASLALVFGQNAVAAGNTSNIVTANGAAVNLPAGTINFTTKQGSDGAVKAYTVITSLGLVGSITKTDLQGINGLLTANYALGSNIDAAATSTWNGNAGFTPIGSGNVFSGTFDGLGHTISNLTINRTTDTVGLFGQATRAVIRNVGLVNASVRGASFVGGLVGNNDNGSLISNSYATGSVSGTSYVGGLVGTNTNLATISNSYATGSVRGTGTNVGGLVGDNNSSTITSSYATGSVSGASIVGGLVGYNNGGTISNSYATGSVSGTSSTVGGLVGNNSGLISNSYATGSVSGTSKVGGLVGDNFFGTISYSYATGSVSGTSKVGGLVGDNFFGTITSSYWDTETSGLSTGVGASTATGATGLTTAQMMSMASFAGFNIANTAGSSATWRIYEGQTRPLLMGWLKPLTVTANSDGKTYNGTAYSGGNGVSYSGASPNPALSGTPTYGGTSQSAVNAGTYTLGVSGLYSVQQGYDISYVAGTLTINKAPATVTANSDAKTYTGLSQSVSGFTASGLVNNETTSVLSGVSASGASGTNPGSYTATAGVGSYSGNYTLSFVNGNLIIKPDVIITSQQAEFCLPWFRQPLHCPEERFTQTDAVAPPPALSKLPYVYVTTTPGTPSSNIEPAADGVAVPTKAQASKSDDFNARLSDAPIPFTGTVTVTVRNGGINFPSDADGANARLTKSGSN